MCLLLNVKTGLTLENMARKKVNKRSRAEAEAEINPTVPRHTDSRLTGNKFVSFLEVPAVPPTKSVQVREHFAAVGSVLCSAVSRGDFCDTDIALADDTTVRFMSLLLESHSDVLKAMLNSGMKEEREHRIELKHVDPDTFRSLLGFTVSG